jgi:hypothetical protein
VDYKAEFDATQSAKPSIPRPATPRRTPAKTRG